MTFSFPRPAAWDTALIESNDAAINHARTDVMPKALTLNRFLFEVIKITSWI